MNPVLQPAIATGGYFPFELQFEIFVLAHADKVFTVVGLGTGFEAAILNGPGITSRSEFGRVQPVLHGLAIEQKFPASFLFSRGQRVLRQAQSGGEEKGYEFHWMV